VRFLQKLIQWGWSKVTLGYIKPFNPPHQVLTFVQRVLASVMALGNRSTNRDALIRFLFLLTVLILSLLILPFAFTHAELMSSNSTTTWPTLMLYDLLFPFGSIVYVSVQYILARLRGTYPELKANLIALTLSILLVYGGIVNNVVWILCEFRRICPFNPPTHSINPYKCSIAKLVFAWMIVIVVFRYVIFVALQTRAANQKARQGARAGQEKDFDEAKVDGDTTEVMKI
jgi:hypothetical protein